MKFTLAPLLVLFMSMFLAGCGSSTSSNSSSGNDACSKSAIDGCRNKHAFDMSAVPDAANGICETVQASFDCYKDCCDMKWEDIDPNAPGVNGDTTIKEHFESDPTSLGYYGLCQDLEPVTSPCGGSAVAVPDPRGGRLREEGEDCGGGLCGPNNCYGDCAPELECRCVGDCADPRIADAPATCQPAQDEQAEQFSGCTDTDGGVVDYYGFTCADYSELMSTTLDLPRPKSSPTGPTPCGLYDSVNSGFTAAEMCCACGGGSSRSTGGAAAGDEDDVKTAAGLAFGVILAVCVSACLVQVCICGGIVAASDSIKQKGQQPVLGITSILIACVGCCCFGCIGALAALCFPVDRPPVVVVAQQPVILGTQPEPDWPKEEP